MGDHFLGPPLPPWTKLRVLNDWGSEYYAWPGRGLNERGTTDTSQALVMAAGDRVEVRWPDRSVTTETLVTRTRHVTIGDMGHDYHTTSTTYGVEVSAHGVSTFVPITALEVREGSFKERGGR